MKTCPIIATKKINESLTGFYCKSCKRMHTHGRASNNPNGKRVSHCNNPSSPLFEIDYYLVEVLQ